MKKWFLALIFSIAFLLLDFSASVSPQPMDSPPDALAPPQEILESSTFDNGMLAVGYDAQKRLCLYQTLDIPVTAPDILLDLFFYHNDPENMRRNVRLFHLRDSEYLPCAPALLQENPRQLLYEFDESFQKGDILRVQVSFLLEENTDKSLTAACHGPATTVTENPRKSSHFHFPMGFTNLTVDVASPGTNETLFEHSLMLVLKPF